MNDRIYPRRSSLSFLLLSIAMFALGIMADRSGLLPGASRRPPAGLGNTFDPFWEAWHLVENHYVDRQQVQPKRMTQGAIEGMLASLGDTGHTTYLTPEELKELETSLKGQLEGIGATMTFRDRRPTIMQTLPGSPARDAGLQPGDVLLEVDGKAVQGLSLQRIVEMVRGPAGTVVHLRILRRGQSKPRDFDITRAKVEIPDVSWHQLPGQPIVHLAIHSFGNHADAQLRKAFEEFRAQGIKGLLLDVRGNPGGLKDQAVAVTSEFLSGGNVFLEQDAHGRRKAIPVKEGGVAQEIPVCVLIDEGTASSAEIFAGALQDHQRGKLVGTRTVGTGTVLEPFPLSDGSAVLLAVAEWFTPNGRQIWHQGITPDVEQALPEGANVLMPEEEEGLDADTLAKSSDKQLLKALEVLRQQIP
jgi:carboxyl-terminal processing protease